METVRPERFQTEALQDRLEADFEAQFQRLARLCAAWTGDPGAADDLAQETLVEAWRNAHKLTEPAGLPAWLAAIARRVCLRWGRQRGRELRRLVELDEAAPAQDLPSPEPPAGERDLELELERDELANLLDKALALLPVETRGVLVERYLAGSSLAESALRLGLSRGAVAVRLHRGRLALRQVLETALQDETAAYRLAGQTQADPGPQASWQETRIWCPSCGRRHLLGRLTPDELVLHCPDCDRQSYLQQSNFKGMYQGLKSFKAALTRISNWAHPYYLLLEPSEMRCSHCGGPVRRELYRPESGSHPGLNSASVLVCCPACQLPNFSSLSGMLLQHPGGQAFWRRNPRLVALPERLQEVAGRPARLVGYQAYGGRPQLWAAFDNENFRLLRLFEDD